MKITQKLMIGLLIAPCLLTLTSCGHSFPAQAANELHFDLGNLSEVTISYDEEPVTFYQSDNNELVIKEYMTEHKERYFANVKQSGNRLHISEGWKPFLKNSFTRYIEVYFPNNYQENLTVATTNGNITITDADLNLSSLRIDSTAGTVHLSSADASVIYLSTTSGTLDLETISGEQIKLETTSGTITCEKLDGNVTYTTTSGDIDVKSAVGYGSYQATNSGNINIVYSNVTGNLTLFNKNGNIDLTLPQNLAFAFDATTKNGSVTTSFQENVSIDGHTTYGTIGSSPAVAVKAETKNGNIQLAQHSAGK